MDSGNTITVLFISLFLLIGTASSAKSQTQTLILTSLPKPTPLSLPDSETNPDALSDSDSVSALSLELHHLDSLLSVSSAVDTQALFNLRLSRDSKRVERIASLAAGGGGHHVRGGGFSSAIVSGLTNGSGEYFTRVGLGTPPKYLYMVLDTGSDIIWLQCSPCKKCYKQSDPFFNPRMSRSYENVTCDAPPCRRLDSSGCDLKTKTCLYQVSYGDGSFTSGELSTETMTFRRTAIPRVTIGCGHDNEGLFVAAAGLLGLGRGHLSFPAQAGRRFGRKFSYCLVNRMESSKPSSLIFGEAAVSRNTRFTPLLTNPHLDTFYYVELVGISVGGERVRGITASLFEIDPKGNGGVIVDSGTSVTRLTEPAYVALRDAFRSHAELKKAPDFSLFDTCFDLSGLKSVIVPTVVLHFRGADVALPASNYLIPVNNVMTFCFAFAGTKGGLSIIGNIQQQGFRVVFDLAESRVGFAPRGCA